MQTQEFLYEILEEALEKRDTSLFLTCLHSYITIDPLLLKRVSLATAYNADRLYDVLHGFSRPTYPKISKILKEVGLYIQYSEEGRKKYFPEV